VGSSKLRIISQSVLFSFLTFSSLAATSDPVASDVPINLAFVSTSPWIDTSDRQVVLDLFEDNFSMEPAQIDWTGSHQSCETGTSSRTLKDQSISRVNFYRAMAGVPAQIVEEPVFSAKAQHGALTMSAEGVLSHEPDDTYTCLNDFGKEAAANSNLYLGRVGPNAIDGYIEDPGEGNSDVGHRSTVLHPPTKLMGVGHTEAVGELYQSNVLWVFDEFVFDDWPEIREVEQFVAWPPRGFVPAEIVHPRWSFSLKDADFSQAKVQMFEDGVEIETEVVARLSEIGQVPPPVIVWQPEISLVSPADSDRNFEVRISEVETPDGLKDFSYELTII